MKFSNTLLGLAAGLFACSASALSLGEAHGRVLLGKPLDLVFDIHTDPGTELNLACVRASVQAGETFIDNSRLRITALPVLAGRAPSVRVLSSAVVMEPILSLRLSVGCSGVVARNYDFFADVPTALVASKRPLVIAPPAAAAPLSPEKAEPSEPSEQASKPAKPAKQSKQSKPPQSPKSPTPPKQQLEADSADSAEAAASVGESARAAPRKSRLTVEPLGDWLAQSTPAPLRLSPQLQEEPSEKSSEQRAQAAALWQLLNISAQDVQQTQLRLQQLQAEIDAARASSAKMQTTVSALQTRVDKLDVQRFPAALLYSLLALLVLICAALAWLWQRTRARKPGRFDSDWSHSEALRDKEPAYTPPSDSENPGATASAPATAPAKALAKTPQPSAAPLSLAKGGAVLAPPETQSATVAASVAVEQQQTTPAALTPAIAAAAAAAAVRMLHPEELFDLQQQAEFFISVGEHDQAIEVMKKHIEENRTASPLMYLELLRLYRSLSRRDDFSDLRSQFQQHFNALVPEFSAFQGGGRTLLDYPDTAASIEAVWSDSAVLALLESYIFCQHNGQKTVIEPFELPAYDDLLLLYAIASTIPAETRGAPPPRQRTMPYTVAEPAQPQPQPLDPLNLPEQDLLSPAALPALDEVDFDLAPFLDPALLAPLPVAQSDASLALEAAPAAPALGNLIEYDAHQLSNRAALASAPVPAPQPRAGQSAWTLDLDLSDPNALELPDLPPLTEAVIPALAVTPAPAPGASIGFGAISDRFEARFDLEEDADAARRLKY